MRPEFYAIAVPEDFEVEPTDPATYVDFCLAKLSRNVVLLHDYALPEWTIIVHR